MIGFLGLK